MPHFEGCVFRFEELAIVPDLAAYVWGEASIEIDATGNWYIDTISVETISGMECISDAPVNTRKSALAKIIKETLYQTERRRISERCEHPGRYMEAAQ